LARIQLLRHELPLVLTIRLVQGLGVNTFEVEGLIGDRRPSKSIASGAHRSGCPSTLPKTRKWP